MVRELPREEFDSFVSEGKKVVDLWAEWCFPCKLVSPLLEKISNTMEGVEFGKFNIEEGLDIVERYGVQSIPTVLVFKDGKLLGRVVGARPDIKERIEKLLEEG